jgi:hypothetical protein
VAQTAWNKFRFSYYYFVLYYGGLFLPCSYLWEGECVSIFLLHYHSDAGDPCRNFRPCQAYLESKFIPLQQGCLWSLIARGSLRSKVFNFDQLASLSDTLMLFVSEQSEKDDWCSAISELNPSIFAVPFSWTVYRQTLRVGTMGLWIFISWPRRATNPPDKFCDIFNLHSLVKQKEVYETTLMPASLFRSPVARQRLRKHEYEHEYKVLDTLFHFAKSFKSNTRVD